MPKSNRRFDRVHHFICCCVKMIFFDNIVAFGALIVCSMAYGSKNIAQIAQFTNAFIANENVPLTISVMASCWTRNNMVHFALESLTFAQFIDRVDPVSRFPVNHSPNHLLFFVDMSCADGVQFLSQVCPLQISFTDSLSLRHMCSLLTRCLFFLFVRLFICCVNCR